MDHNKFEDEHMVASDVDMIIYSTLTCTIVQNVGGKLPVLECE